jgi:hypothetical protein
LSTRPSGPRRFGSASAISANSFRVDAGESRGLSVESNQNAWHAPQPSTSIAD